MKFSKISSKILEDKELSRAEKMMREKCKKSATYKTSMKTHPLSGPERHLTAVSWVMIDPDHEFTGASAIKSAWKKLKDSATNYVSWDDLAKATSYSVEEIAQTLKAVWKRDPEAISMTVNRMGDNVFVKINKPDLGFFG